MTENAKTLCPICGFDVRVDEDGCCVDCGATAVGGGVDAAHTIRRKFDSIDLELFEVLDRAGALNIQFAELISENGVLAQYPDLRQAVYKAEAALMDMYQTAGEEWQRQIAGI